MILSCWFLQSTHLQVSLSNSLISTSSPQSIHHMSGGREDAREQSVHMLSLALLFMSPVYLSIRNFSTCIFWQHDIWMCMLCAWSYDFVLWKKSICPHYKMTHRYTTLYHCRRKFSEEAIQMSHVFVWGKSEWTTTVHASSFYHSRRNFAWAAG